MISKSYILRNLSQLDNAYRDAKSQKHALYFSKLAILELCGWIETSMDDIVLAHCKRNVKLSVNSKYISDDVVKRTYGFDYQRHFRKMLISLIGIVACEKVEAQFSSQVHVTFTAQLNSLKLIRDRLAHTYLKGSAIAVSIDAPSVTKARFNDIYVGLKEFERVLRTL